MTEQQERIPERTASVIFETNEYERFEKPKTGRPLVPTTLREITETMQRRGFWPGKAMTVKPNGNGLYQILDGNHRFEAAKKLGLPVKYVVDHSFTLNDVVESNKNVAPWKSSDYMHHFAESGSPEYAYLRLFLKNNPHVALSTTIYALGKGSTRGRKGPTKMFKRGGWQMDTTFANQFAEVMRDYARLTPSVAKLMHFNLAVAKIMRTGKYDHKRMLKKLGYLRRRVVRCSLVAEYVDMLEEIYNHKARGRNRVSFN